MFSRKNNEILPEDRVKLPVILGIRPGHYLAVLYSVLLLFILFVIFVYPGLSKPGAIGLIHSDPEGAAVRVDGVTLGTSPCRVFIPRGKRTIEITLPGFESVSKEINVSGRVFASMLFPQKITLAVKLTAHDPAAAFAAEAADFARWSFMGEPDEAHQAPLSLSEGAYRTGRAASDAAIKAEMEDILAASLRFTSSAAAARDMARALFLTGNAGRSPSPFTLIRSLQDAASRLSSAPEKQRSQWLLSPGKSPEENVSAISITINGAAPASVSPGGLEFIPVPGGGVTVNGRILQVSPMLIARSELTESAWNAFIAENPEWSPEKREQLAEKGLVSRDYLLAVDAPSYPRPAVPGISWYAAKAYCRWLSGKLSAEWRDWEVRLPTEYEWDYAAVYFDGRPGPENVMGGLWEWCEDFYAPLDFFSAPASAIDAVGSPERSVKGGSWINPPGSVGIETRASLPPHVSSPFTGFRPVIAPKNR